MECAPIIKRDLLLFCFLLREGFITHSIACLLACLLTYLLGLAIYTHKVTAERIPGYTETDSRVAEKS